MTSAFCASGPLSLRIGILAIAVLVPALATVECVRPPSAAAQTWQLPDSLDLGLAATLNASAPVLGIDNYGRTLGVWVYGFAVPGEIYWARYSPGVGWGSKTRLDLHGLADRVYGIDLAMNGSGSAYLAWYGQAGLYAAAYDPVQGWTRPVTIRPGPNPFIDFVGGLALGIDANRGGLMVWANPNSDSIFYATTADGASWTAPQSIFDVHLQLGAMQFDSNAGGEAVLVWERHPAILSPWNLYAARYDPSTGWASPTPLSTSPTYHSPTVAMNDSGAIVVAWVDNFTNFPNFDIYQRRYGAGQGPIASLSARAEK